MKAISDPVEFYAVRLHDAMSGMGTNDSQLIIIIVSRAEVRMSRCHEQLQIYLKIYFILSRIGFCLENPCGLALCVSSIRSYLCVILQNDLAAIKTCYKKLYKKTLEESIDGDTSGDYKRLLLALVRGDK